MVFFWLDFARVSPVTPELLVDALKAAAGPGSPAGSLLGAWDTDSISVEVIASEFLGEGLAISCTPPQTNKWTAAKKALFDAKKK